MNHIYVCCYFSQVSNVINAVKWFNTYDFGCMLNIRTYCKITLPYTSGCLHFLLIQVNLYATQEPPRVNVRING